MEATFFSILNSRHCESTEVKVRTRKAWLPWCSYRRRLYRIEGARRARLLKVLSRWLYRLDTQESGAGTAHRPWSFKNQELVQQRPQELAQPTAHLNRLQV